MTLDIHLLSENYDFSIESLAILALINYLELSNDCINTYLYFDDFDEAKLLSFFNKYKQYYFFVRNNDASINKGSIELRILTKDTNECFKYDVALPFVVNKIDQAGIFIVYSGLSAIYRLIVLHAAKCRNNVENLLLLVSFFNLV